jgi:hypothetical protein
VDLDRPSPGAADSILFRVDDFLSSRNRRQPSSPERDEPMTASHRVVSIKDFLRTNLEGTADFEATKAVFEEIIAACKASSINRILLDIREVYGTDVGVTEVFLLVMHLLSLDLARDFQMAIVNRPKDELDRAKIFEHSARLQGVNVASFDDDFEGALMWLNDGWV